MKASIILFFLFAVSSSGFCEEITLRNEKLKSQVQIVPYPHFPELLLVSWEKIPNKTPNGVLVFKKRAEAYGTRYITVGQGEPFSFFEPKETLKVNGLRSFKFDFDLRDSATILSLVEKKPNQAEILAAYRKAQGAADPAVTRPQLEESLRERAQEFNSQCSGQVRTEVKWEEFSTPEKLPLVMQLGGVLAGLAEACLDPIYKSEISKIKTLELKLNDRDGEIVLNRKDKTLTVLVPKDAVNAKNHSHAWALKTF